MELGGAQQGVAAGQDAQHPLLRRLARIVSGVDLSRADDGQRHMVFHSGLAADDQEVGGGLREIAHGGRGAGG